MAAKETIDRWFNRLANTVSFWTIVPPGILAVVSAVLASGVGLINQFGAWGWFTAGLVAFFLSSVAFALIARTKLWRFEAKRTALLAGDGSPFDPMASVYEGKRLYLRDLAPAGRNLVVGRTFINCEIIGPGTIIVGTRTSDSKPWPAITNTGMIDSDCIQIFPDAKSALAVNFLDCAFHDTRFFHLTLLFIEALWD